eukprot:SAG22_NODE_234_length_14360_cov_13.245915_9_plen_147_part_00
MGGVTNERDVLQPLTMACLPARPMLLPDGLPAGLPAHPPTRPPARLPWLHCTGCSELEGGGGSWAVEDDGKKLLVNAPSKKDFWRKTYYQPVLVKDDGPCLFATVPDDKVVMVEASFSLDPKRQFDQAGLCVRLGPEHWIKTGVRR